MSMRLVLAAVPVLLSADGAPPGARATYHVTALGPGVVRPRGPIHVSAGEILTIRAGTRIEMDSGTRLVIDRNAFVQIEGTVLQPVVLTCAGSPFPGCWEGVIIAGHAPINLGTTTSPPARRTGVGGCREVATDPQEPAWGGCDADDSSGVMRYVRIEHAAQGLDLRGVGRGTVIDHVQITDASSVGVVVAGGTVDIAHLLVTGNAGPALSYDAGWVGRGQYLHLEVDASDAAGAGIVGRNGAQTDATPRSQPHLRNVTLAGRGTLQGTPAAIRLSEGGGLRFEHGLIVGLLTALDVDGSTTCAQFGTGIVVTTSLIVGALGDPDEDACPAGAQTETSYLTEPTRGIVDASTLEAGSMLRAPYDDALPDVRPRAGGAAAIAPAIAGEGFLQGSPWYGATEPDAGGATIPWHSGWTTPLHPVARALLVPLVPMSQVALVGTSPNARPAVRVTDATGRPITGAPVRFGASAGGLVVGATPSLSANGVAQVGEWIVSSAPGPNTLSATLAGALPVQFSVSAEPAAFSIAVQNVGPSLSADFAAAIETARQRWQRLVYRDVPDVPAVSVPAGFCGNTLTVGPVDVDDVLVLLAFDHIDGPGRVLGQAGPCLVRSVGRQTVVGQLTLDSADARSLLQQGRLVDVMLHEIGHVLGIGTLWTQPTFDCLRDASVTGTPSDTYYRCVEGRAAFDSLGGLAYAGAKVPVENCASCGTGTINTHWREGVFDAELMTGFIDLGGNPLSRLTVASLADLGYGVSLSGADSYQVSFGMSAAFRTARTPLGAHVRNGPILDVRSSTGSGRTRGRDRRGSSGPR